MSKSKVLFVAFQFPPLAAAGSYRPFRFVKYLKENSDLVDPLVVTLARDSFSNVYDKVNLDEIAASEIAELNISVLEVPATKIHYRNRLERFISIYFNVFKGSEAKHWEQAFTKKFKEIIEEYKIEMVYVTAPPFSIATLVGRLARKFKVPYVVDMRDNWSLWLSQPHGSRMHYWLNRYYEKQLYDNAAKIIGVTEPQVEDIKGVTSANDRKVNFIPNSFDQEVMNDVTYLKKPNQITIGYVGNFYYDPVIDKLLNQKWHKRPAHRKFYFWPRKERWRYRSPYYFFKLLSAFKAQHPEIQIKVNFAGRKPDWLDSMVNEFQLDDQVEHYGFLKGDDLSEFYAECDLLLITSAKLDQGKDTFIASKTFDYLKRQKKILGLVCEGAQKDFLQSAGESLIIDPDFVENGISDLYQLATANQISYTLNQEYLDKYSTQNTARQLEEIMQAVLKENN